MADRGVEAGCIGHRANPAAAVKRGALVLVAALTLGGCERKVTLATHDTDTTAVLPADSLEAVFHEVRIAWEQGTDDDAAARLAARALFEDLRRREPAEWRSRAGELLDSLGVGSETHGPDCALLVNLFPRSDPARGSWPYLYWCDRSGPHWQEVEGQGMKLLAAAIPASDSASAEAPSRLAALYARSRSGRNEPLLFVWGRGPKPDHWSVIQTLGPDSLGGFGAGAFESVRGDTMDLVVRTYRPLPRFDECATCPHAYWNHRFRWTERGYERAGAESEPSPFATFARFIGALVGGHDPAEFVVSEVVTEQARALEWDRAKGVWRVAPGTEGEGSELTMFRGAGETYRLAFEPRGGDWLLAGIEVVPRSVE